MNQLSILPLAHHPEMLNTLAEWTYGEWGRFDPANSLERTKERLRERMNPDHLPICFVAHLGGDPVGCVSIKLRDMPERFPEAEHWIGSMFVREDRRGTGVGSAMIAYLVSRSAALGVKEIFLWTATAEAFYSKHAFSPVDRFAHLNQSVIVMHRPIYQKGAQK